MGPCPVSFSPRHAPALGAPFGRLPPQGMDRMTSTHIGLEFLHFSRHVWFLRFHDKNHRFCPQFTCMRKHSYFAE